MTPWPLWSGSSATIKVPSSPGNYYVWVRCVPTTSNSAAIQAFKNETPASSGEERNNKWGTKITVQEKSPDCDSHDHTGCYQGDSYWYDSCNNREEKNEECGESEYVGSNYCLDGDVYRNHENVGCDAGSCYLNTNQVRQEVCSNGCSNGACLPDGSGSGGSSHASYRCSEGNIYWFDSEGNREELKESCGISGYTGEAYCGDDDNLYRDYVTKDCSDSACYEVIEKKKIYDCRYECKDGECDDTPPPEETYKCYDNDVYWFDANGNKGNKKEECGDDGYVGNAYCEGDKLYQDYEKNICSDDTCISQVEKKSIDCVYGCEDDKCKNKPDSHDYYECYSGDVYWYNSAGNREEKKEECGESGYSGDAYCDNNDVYRDYEKNICSDDSCDSDIQKMLILNCEYECIDGACTHDSYKCYNDDVYWYNSNGEREGVKEYCEDECVNGKCVSTSNDCVISYLAETNPYQLETFRKFRDEVLLKNSFGREIVKFNYQHSDEIVSLLEEYPILKNTAKKMMPVVIPMIKSLLDSPAFHKGE